MAMISRDPSARTELHREVVEDPRGCAWCGQPRYTNNGTDRTNKLFVYITESDGGRRGVHYGHFCSKPCHDAYHNH